MHAEYFYILPGDVFENEVVFRQAESRHLSDVLRKKAGDVVFAVDGLGTEYRVRIIRRSRNDVTAEILDIRKNAGEPGIELTLAQGVLKGNRLDWLVEKAVEIGVGRILLVDTANTRIGSLSTGRLSRLKKIALSAMKQSGRSFLPEIISDQSINRVFKTASEYDVRLIAHPVTEPFSGRLGDLFKGKNARRVLCLVGPEGGFEESEIAQAADTGFLPVSLGPSRLRSETAGIVLSAVVLSNFNDMK